MPRKNWLRIGKENSVVCENRRLVLFPKNQWAHKSGRSHWYLKGANDCNFNRLIEQCFRSVFIDWKSGRFGESIEQGSHGRVVDRLHDFPRAGKLHGMIDFFVGQDNR